VSDYFAPHIRLVHWLRCFGVYYDINARLPLMYLRHHVQKLTDNQAKLEEVRKLIDECVTMRREGQEPFHKNGRYT
jgi:hypothetical protein